MTKLSEMTTQELVKAITESLPYLQLSPKERTLFVECYTKEDLKAVKLLRKKNLTPTEQRKLSNLAAKRRKFIHDNS